MAKSDYTIAPLTLGEVATYPLDSRKSKVSLADFAKTPVPNPALKGFLDGLPGHLLPDPIASPESK